MEYYTKLSFPLISCNSAVPDLSRSNCWKANRTISFLRGFRTPCSANNTDSLSIIIIIIIYHHYHCRLSNIFMRYNSLILFLTLIPTKNSL